MPLKSKAQEKYLWANKPSIAKKFERDTPKRVRTKLPEKVRRRGNS